jgi:predicted house-cleaning noncanonical NTP pyrophosphatase (MazG superfamily)
MKRIKEESRREVGILVTTSSTWLIYEVTWSDGSRTLDRGRAVHGYRHYEYRRRKKRKLPAHLKELTRRTYREDLGIIMRAASPFVEILTDACHWADEKIPEPKRCTRSRKPRPKRRKPTRVVEL